MNRRIARGRSASHLPGWVLVAVVLLASASLTVTAAPWSTQILSGARVLLNCPTLISVDAARALLADRERALAFAEETLGGQLFRRLFITIEPTLLTSWGLTEPTDGGGAIAFHVPVFALERFETDGTSPFEFAGCHEEVHAVANHLWEANEFGTLSTLSEGVAVYVEELRRGTELHWTIAGALQKAGFLYDVDRLMEGSSQDDPLRVIHLNVYYGGASLAEFLIERYGMEAFSELYGVEWIRWDVRHPEGGPVEADPAEEILRIYGKTAAEIDAEWQPWVASHATGTVSDAETFLQAFVSDIDPLDADVTELEAHWAASPLRLVGPSPLVAGLYESVTDALYALPALHGTALAEAYSAFRTSLDRLEVLLAEWLVAIHAYDEALELASEDGDAEQITTLLEAAEAGYRAVGDEVMADKAAERRAAL